ncbi:MAG TPA: hypothetical protein VFR85_13425 [Anaeromyxobacteraceae bacterium]|nr:hypothetical protein [Anaeromyxobacteraceae bacterium]
MTLSCDRCGRHLSTAEAPVPGRVYRVPCRCGTNLAFEIDSTGQVPARLAPRFTPPPLPPDARAGPHMGALAFGGAAPAEGSDRAPAGATVLGPMAPAALAAWVAALPEPDVAARAPVEPSAPPEVGGLAGIHLDPDEGLEHSVLAWISAETARERAFATGFASGSGAAVVVLVAAAWLGTAAAHPPFATGNQSLMALPAAQVAPQVSAPAASAEPAPAARVARQVSAPAASAEPAPAPQDPLASVLALAALAPAASVDSPPLSTPVAAPTPTTAAAASPGPVAAAPAAAVEAAPAPPTTIAAPRRSTPQTSASRDVKAAPRGRAPGKALLAHRTPRADAKAPVETRSEEPAEPVIETRSTAEAEPAAEGPSASESESVAARSEPGTREPAGSGEPQPAPADVGQTRVATPDATAAKEPVSAPAQAPNAESAPPAPNQAPEAVGAPPGPNPLASKF